MQLHLIDVLAIVLYLLGITWFGLRFRNGERSLRSYFLADRNVPWWAIALSIVSAETSTLTIISVPGLAFTGDFGFLQIALGYLLGRIVICLLFLPRYFEGQLMTAYQLIGARFGKGLHRFTAGLFLATRAVAEGVRIFAVSIVITVAFGTGTIPSIIILTILTLIYTFEGGFAAVIWTDVVQMLIYFAGTILALWTLAAKTPGGWTAIHHTAAAAHKFTIFHFAFSLTQTYTFWGGLIGGCFLTMASHGTDQLVVQRLLAARNLVQSQIALLASGVIVFVQFTLFLLIGAGLYVFYPAGVLAHVGTADRLFPLFIVQDMPHGVSGLVIAAILAAAMSNMSAALNSLSSTTMVDFYLPRHPDME
ncbi:MAG: sodium/solute symporter, partial [Acidobacteriaceae bacterium]